MIWSVVFIIVPLGMILYYGLTDTTGTFTLDNITAIASATRKSAADIVAALSCEYTGLLSARLSACHDSSQSADKAA